LVSSPRDSLGALATAIREFDGGVVLISHNSEFTSTCCHETWFVRDGKVGTSRARKISRRETMDPRRGALGPGPRAASVAVAISPPGLLGACGVMATSAPRFVAAPSLR
jgi:hypothetical protein